MRYVSIEPKHYDSEVNEMPGEARCFHSRLIVYLLAHDGWAKDDMAALAVITGMDDLAVTNRFNLCKHLYVRRNGKLFHKKIRSDLARAKILSQRRAAAGLTGSEVKKLSLSKASAKLSLNVNVNEKVNTNSFTKGLCAGIIDFSPLNFARELQAILKVPNIKNQDWSALQNVGQLCYRKIKAGQATEDLYEQVKDIAREATSGRRPIALFFTLLKIRMRYERQNRGATGTLADELKKMAMNHLMHHNG